jgi:hypothetical protein
MAFSLSIIDILNYKISVDNNEQIVYNVIIIIKQGGNTHGRFN